MAVTHELKTPLTSMGVYLDTLQSDKIPAVKKQAVVPRLHQDLKRLGHLVDDILEAGRFETGEFKPNRQRVDLAAVLDSCAERLLEYAGSTTVKLTREIEPEVWVQADVPIVSRAVSAVLENAAKYSGGAEIRIALSLRRHQGKAVISIADNGVGIARDELKLIFERFYRIGHELTRARGGTGLGLYLSREMIRAHGGDIVARSEGIGRGAEFIITLPLDEST